jgi:transcription elongation factor
MVFSFLVLMENTEQAQIFKCVGNKGNIVYQDKACSITKRQSEVEFDQLNPDIILKAQKELSDELNRRKERKALRAQQELREREILAIEEQARSNEELSRAARENHQP